MPPAEAGVLSAEERRPRNGLVCDLEDNTATSSSPPSLHAAKKSRAAGLHNGQTPSPRPVVYSQHWSREGTLRHLPSLRQLISTFQGMPGIIGMHGGLPPDSAFPITKVTVTLQDGTEVQVTDTSKLAAAQQYSTTFLGYAPLQQWAHLHTEAMHNPPAPHHTLICNGSNHTLELLCSLLLDQGDPILCEEYTYAHIVESLIGTKGYRPLPLRLDSDGIVPAALREVLQKARQHPGPGRPPRLLYTVPTGQNPTGITVPHQRKREIYQICHEFDVIIIEDDPYFYLQFSQTAGEELGLQSLGQSYLSMDRDGRVVRLDSFAKFLAPGLRLGWASGHPDLVTKLACSLHSSTLGPCSLSQVVVAEMLAGWGEAGLEQHVQQVQRSYHHRAQVLQAAAEEHLTGLATWSAPRAGMFLWLKLGAGVRDADEVLDLLKQHKVVVAPGRISHCYGPVLDFPCPYVRLSFANSAEEDLQEGIRRLSQVLRSFQEAKSCTQ